MSESNLQVANIGDLVLIHHDNTKKTHKRSCDIILIWDLDQGISLTDLLPRHSQRESLDVYSDPEDFCALLREVVVDPLFRLRKSFEPLARPITELVGERDYVMLRPSGWAVRKCWLGEGCC